MPPGNGGEPGSAGPPSGSCEDAPVQSGHWAWHAVGALQTLAFSQALSCSEPFLLLLIHKCTTDPNSLPAQHTHSSPELNSTPLALGLAPGG